MFGNETNESCAQFPQDDFKVIAAVRAATGPVSVVLGALAILINVLYKKYRFQFHQMVLYISVGAVLRGITGSLVRVDYFVQNEATTKFCSASGFVDIYSLWIVILATVGLSYNLSNDLVRNRLNSSQRHHRCFWFFVIFVFPLSFLWVPFLYSAYGRSPNSPWCGIRTLDDNCIPFVFGQVVYSVLTTIIFLLGIFVVILYLVAIIFFVRRQRQWVFDSDGKIINSQLKREVLALILPILAYTTAFIVSAINIIIISKSGYVFAVWIIEAFYTPTSIIAFLLTVEREICSKPVICLNYKHKANVYHIEAADEERRDYQDMVVD